MIIYKRVDDLKSYLEKNLSKEYSTGFVPTMGALHEGHISLIKKCKEKNHLALCSIFINPAQFNNPSDFTKYPVTIEKDIDLLEQAGCDVLFLPPVNEVYPEGFIFKHYDLGYLETILEGEYRPGHFQGVCQVVHRLLQITQADKLYLGEKDFQQCMVLKKLIALENIPVEIIVSPTLREKDGLAMSSRNLRLSDPERSQAVYIFKSLQLIKNNINNKDIPQLKSDAIALLNDHGFKVDYVEIANAETLLPAEKTTIRKVILIAAWLNEIRLIDNWLII